MLTFISIKHKAQLGVIGLSLVLLVFLIINQMLDPKWEV